METNALLLERQAAVIENSAHLGLEVGHNVLVPNVQQLAGQHAVPVLHQPLVLQIVFADIEKVVAEGLTLGEKLLEAPEATVKRVASGVDEHRTRQRQVREADVNEIVRVLVGEVRIA